MLCILPIICFGKEYESRYSSSMYDSSSKEGRYFVRWAQRNDKSITSFNYSGKLDYAFQTEIYVENPDYSQQAWILSCFVGLLSIDETKRVFQKANFSDSFAKSYHTYTMDGKNGNGPRILTKRIVSIRTRKASKGFHYKFSRVDCVGNVTSFYLPLKAFPMPQFNAITSEMIGDLRSGIDTLIYQRMEGF